MSAATRSSYRLQLLAASLALAIAMVALVSIEYVEEREALLGTLQAQARLVGESSLPALVFDDPGSAKANLASLHSVASIEAAALYRIGAEGEETLFAEYRTEGRPHFPARGRPPAGLQHLALDHPVFLENRPVGVVHVIAGRTQLLTGVSRYALTVGVVAAGALTLAFLLTGGLRRRVLETERLLDNRAHYDELTGLPNRNLFNDRIQHALSIAQRRGTPLALLFFDLDNFKVINDSLGHDAGDRLLTRVARRLRSTIRQADSVCRLGGDEFVAILENSDENAAAHAAEHIIAALSRPYALDGREVCLGTSIGVALYPRDGAGPGQLLRAADTALYAAKAAGKGMFRFFSEALDRRAHQRMELESGLRRAISRRELSLHYQVQVDAHTGAATGAEALLRWTSPVFGEVPPASFIPVAEESGLIRDIGAWVLREACRQAAEWIPRAPGFVMAVNVSARQLADPGLAEQVRDCLEHFGVPPERLELEITESALLTDGAHEVYENLRALDALRVGLSLDDFGTGYSSLGYLKRLPIGRLKIDRGFTSHLPDGPDDAAIVAAIVAMAGALDMQVVAEGVETEAQHAFLRQAGCDFVQGWLFGKSVTPEAFERAHLPPPAGAGRDDPEGEAVLAQNDGTASTS